VNDTLEDAKRLIRITHGIRCKINLIPFNEFPESRFCRPTDQSILKFQEVLKKGGLTATVRKNRGMDILAACGQLRGTTAT